MTDKTLRSKIIDGFDILLKAKSVSQERRIKVQLANHILVEFRKIVPEKKKELSKPQVQLIEGSYNGSVLITYGENSVIDEINKKLK